MRVLKNYYKSKRSIDCMGQNNVYINTLYIMGVHEDDTSKDVSIPSVLNTRNLGKIVLKLLKNIDMSNKGINIVMCKSEVKHISVTKLLSMPKVELTDIVSKHVTKNSAYSNIASWIGSTCNMSTRHITTGGQGLLVSASEVNQRLKLKQHSIGNLHKGVIETSKQKTAGLIKTHKALTKTLLNIMRHSKKVKKK